VEGLHAKLYPYQKDGVAFLRLVADEGLGCILGDEMGLGKTLQVIALIQAETNVHRAPALVIAPATLLENWRRELALFAPQLSVLVHAGPNRPGQAGKLTSFDVVVTSYETAVRDEPMLSSVSWNVLAVDEAQSIRNPEAQRTLAIKRLPRRVSLAVTGTPVENRLADLWSLSDFALPGLLGGVADFHAAYDDTATDASRLAVVVAPILLRRRVSEVAKDLPPRIDIPQCIMMTRALAETYEEVRKEAEAEYGPAAGLVSLQKLRMFCSHPMLVDRWEGDPATGMPKFQRLLEILEEVFARGEKALVFGSYTKMADILVDHLPKAFPSGFFRCIDGRTAIADRQPTVDGFSEFAGYGALVLNPKAAGVGLNITAANHVIHYNPEWNPAVEDQASARAYRRKQTRSVTVHHLYFGDTVEDVMVARLNFKRSLAGAAVTGHTGDATTADVLRALAISPMSQIGSLE
jgi:SNF2 family DNA or RNA helicase